MIFQEVLRTWCFGEVELCIEGSKEKANSQHDPNCGSQTIWMWRNCVLFGLGRFRIPISTAIFWENKITTCVFVGIDSESQELANDDAELSDLKDRWSQRQRGTWRKGRCGCVFFLIMEMSTGPSPNATFFARNSRPSWNGMMFFHHHSRMRPFS